ncbi:MAG TPA: sigma-70 family RNA polymerase sigma factor [Planctomycetota bacterium]|nr:sigma-70 family RNA polymerase sigma factor [Planctomycetota bacterium]
MNDATAIDALVRQAQAGDGEAFGTLVRTYEWAVRAWITARCPAGADADEVAQVTFVEAFKNLGRYQPGGDFRAWLFTIARYQVMSELTRLRRLADYHERYFPHALWQELERRALTLEDAHDDDRLAALRGCLGKLDERARAMLAQRYADDIPVQQMADESRRLVGAIKKHLFVLREQLHDCLTRRLAGEAQP